MAGRQPPGQIGQRHGGRHGPFSRIHIEAEGPGHGQVIDVMTTTVPARPGLAIPGERAIDDFRVGITHGIIPEAQAIHDSGSEGLEKHVAFLDQSKQDLSASGKFDIQGHAVLVPIQGPEEGRVESAHIIAGARLLDF